MLERDSEEKSCSKGQNNVRFESIDNFLNQEISPVKKDHMDCIVHVHFFKKYIVSDKMLETDKNEKMNTVMMMQR